MVVLGLLLLQLGFMLMSVKNKSLQFVVAVTLFWSVCWLIILHLELVSTGSTTYGSDETEYFKTMVRATESENWFSIVRDDANFSYVLFGTLILKTSLWQSVFVVRLCNVVLLVNTLVILFFILTRTFSIHSKAVYWALMAIGINGIVTWTAIRNIKDTFFIYFLIIFIYLLLEWFMNRKRSLWRVAVMIISCYVLQDIRQWFIYLAVIVIGIMFIVQLLRKRRFLIASGLLLVAVISSLKLFKGGLGTLLLYTLAYSDSGLGGDQITGMVNSSFLSLPLSMGRFILGPGPIRGMFGNIAFETYTTTGNILIFLGGMMWWAFLPLFIFALCSIQHFKKYYIVLIFILFYWGTYSYAYAGSGDTRLRAVLYILAILYTVPYLVKYFKREKWISYIALFIPIVLVGSYFSYIGLA